MKSRWFVAMAIALAALTFVRAESPTAKAASEPLYLVTAVAFPATDLTFANVKSSFRGEGVEIRGKRLIPINHPIDAPLRVLFDRVVLGLEPSAVGRFWIDQRIRDEGKPPTTASSPEIAVRIAASLVGAITYTTKSMLNPKLKVLTVDGKAPGQGGYALLPK